MQVLHPVAGALSSSNPLIFSIEISKVRHSALIQESKKLSYPFHYPIWGSSIDISCFPSLEQVVDSYLSKQTSLNNFPLDMVIDWYYRDYNYAIESGRTYSVINALKDMHAISFLRLIDGSEFTGMADLRCLLKMYVLDDNTLNITRPHNFFFASLL